MYVHVFRTFTIKCGALKAENVHAVMRLIKNVMYMYIHVFRTFTMNLALFNMLTIVFGSPKTLLGVRVKVHFRKHWPFVIIQ